MTLFSKLKRRKALRNVVVCLLFAAVSLSSATAANENPSLDWMTGHWCLESGAETVEEFWLPPHGGVVVGLSRTRNSDQTTGFEYLRIADVDGTQNYFAQPGGRPPTRFARTDGGTNWVRFENPGHDFPQRIEYRRAGADLHAEIAGPDDNGQETVIGFDYSPCRSQGPVNEDTEAIRFTRESSNQAIARHDSEGVVSFLDSEYVITTGAGVIQQGREGENTSWAKHFAEFPDVVYVRTPAEVTLSSSDPLAVEHGTWVGTRSTPDGIEHKGGQYTASWKKVDGVWKIRSELFVTLYTNKP